MGAAIADTELAERYGVPVSTVETIRAGLTEGTHWRRVEGRIVLTALGEERLDETLGSLTNFKKKEGGAGGDPPGGGAAGAAEAEAKPGPVLRCRVVRRHPNVTWVALSTPDGLRDVRVRNHAGITLGSLLEARRMPDGTWECANPRQTPPRRR